MNRRFVGKIMRWTLISLSVFILAVLCIMPVRRVMAADLTKAQGELMDWTLLDDTGSATMFLESTEFDDGEGYDASVVSRFHITMVNVGAAADAGSCGFKIFVRVSDTDEGWREFANHTVTGTASNVGDLDDSAAAAQAVIPLTATTNFETPGDVFFLKDEGTIADSCLVIFGGTYTNDVSITVIDDLVNAYDNADNLYDDVTQWNIILPGDCDEAKVLFYNGDADANYACRVDYSNTNDIE